MRCGARSRALTFDAVGRRYPRGGLVPARLAETVPAGAAAHEGKIPADDWRKLNEGLAAEDSGVRVVPLTLGIADDLARVPWRSVPDMPDRIIAATALHVGLPLVSRDGRIQAPGLEVVW